MSVELLLNQPQAANLTAKGPEATLTFQSFRSAAEAMLAGHLSFPPANISELFSAAYEQGGLTLTDRLGLMSALLQNALTYEESLAINRLLYSFRRGRLKFLD